ncbi:hypothetical protein ACQ4PT_061888 [Festuca glaucescens]
MVPLAARAKTTAARGPALPHEPRRAGGSRSAPMAHGERELQVRALDGRSAAVTLAAAAAASVVDLKAVLRSSFPPAQISHNFHLFLKGAELRLDAEIDSLVVSGGQFILLVPFPRMSGQSAPVAMPGEERSTNPPTCTCSWKRRKLCKENGNSSRGTSAVDGASGQPSRSKKSGFVKSAASPCHDKHPLGPAEMVEHLKKGLGKGGQIVHVEEILCRGASYAELPCHLSEAMRDALESIGITRLYSHQSEAIQLSISGKHVAVATSTSSGKSLCYNIPVLESLSQDLTACALYIFPTKALAQDQLRTLVEMKKAFRTDINVNIYNGDTPREDRLWIRDNAQLLITNPDMLHLSILSFHGKFRRIFSNLRYIVIDEAHSYQGAFGCHTALILRRLKRICSYIYGSHPTFMFCTATSANPREHVMELAKLDNVELIQKDGSPCGSKYFLLWNSPLQMTKEGGPKGSSVIRRSSPIVEVSYIFSEMVQHGLRCIAFCKTRKLCELVLSYTREILEVTAKELVDSICVYRAGYVAEDRRKIEGDLFEGKLRGVAATNALELGIDVGHIDATLHLGFPGSVASLWQQAGRAGRRAKQSLAIYVAFGGPLDQHFMKSPHELFGRPIEHCHVDSHNPKIFEQHLACAAYEHPICLQYDEDHFGSSLDSIMTTLKMKGYLINNPSGPFSSTMWNYIGPEKRPSQTVSIRAIQHDKYSVIDKLNNRLLEEIEESKAFSRCMRVLFTCIRVSIT